MFFLIFLGFISQEVSHMGSLIKQATVHYLFYYYDNNVTTVCLIKLNDLVVNRVFITSNLSDCFYIMSKNCQQSSIIHVLR